jgi:hypothetical protein
MDDDPLPKALERIKYKGGMKPANHGRQRSPGRHEKNTLSERIGWEISSWQERLERSKAVERLERLERYLVRAGNIRQHRKKDQSQVQTFETLNSLSSFILDPFALILSRNLSLIPYPSSLRICLSYR